jgi:hypothetical protein
MTRKRTVLPVVLQRMQIAEGLARNLERLGLERKAREVPSLQGVPRGASEAGSRRWRW